MGKHNSSFVESLKPFIKHQFGLAIPGQQYQHPEIKGDDKLHNGFRNPLDWPVEEERFCREGYPRHLCSTCQGVTLDCVGAQHRAFFAFHDI